jgi:membrane fusion protein, macrolide-specific efflux system
MATIVKKIIAALKWIKTHKIISIVIFIIIVTAVFLLYPKPPKNIATQTVKIADFTQSISVSGKVDAQEKVDLRFQTSEKLSYLAVKEGDYVKKGQLIASLDQNQLQASLRQAEQDFTAGKAASQQYYDDHTNATESDEEKVQRTAIDASQNKAYDQIVKVRYDIANSSLYSPINGIVTRMDAETAGVNITPSTTFSIANPDKLIFIMDVNEADISKVKELQSVSISLDAYINAPLNLLISKIDFVTHATTTGGNAYTVQTDIPENPNLRYRVGMEGNATIVTAREQNVMSVSISSLVDNNYVYVQKNKQSYEKRKVEIGIQNDTDSVIKSGLSEGEKVVLDPTQIPQNYILKSLGK